MKTYHFFPVFLVLVASYVGLHFYAARWLVKNFALGHTAHYWLRLALLAAAFLSPFTMFLKRYHHGPLLETLYTAGFAWMGIILIAALVFACSDLAALGLRRAAWLQPRLLAHAALALIAVITAWGVYGGQKVPDIKEIAVPVKNLPPALEGFKIAQISDMHVNSGLKLRRYSGIVDRINSVNPDLVLVTGDLIDPGIPSPEKLGELTGKINSRLGFFGVLGNHDYYYGLDKSMACYKAFGIKLLKNETYELKDLRLIGLGDIHTEHLTQADVTGLLEKHKDGKFTVLMTHQPLYYPAIAATGDYLVFSGHTHKGQIFPFTIFTRLFYKYFYGLYRINNSAFYVTSGSGTWGPPLRWFAAAEIPVITLTAAK
ncbi:MAG: metallophosphoesterase [Elusimicrobiota bacterium]|nr:metallophosphoesterase [Elusimicrobiota bacterium]